MTLEQAIKFCLHMEKEQYKSAHNTIIGDYPEYEAAPHFRLASEYKQIADWLKDLKEAKRLLRLAVENMNDGGCTRSCSTCKYGKDGCKYTEGYEWVHTEEADKLLKED